MTISRNYLAIISMYSIYTTAHTGQFYYEMHSGPQKIKKKNTISNLKMPFTKVLGYNQKFYVSKTTIRVPKKNILEMA